MDRLSGRCLNRTLLQRQHLLSPTDEPVQSVVESLIGLQAQDPQAPHFALWSRINDYVPGDLDSALVSGEVVRIAAFRSTVMLMTATDAFQYYSVATQARHVESRVHAARLGGVNHAAVTRAARQLLTSQTLTATELADKLDDRFPGADRRSLVGLARCTLPLVQTPPRGLWRQPAAVSYRTLLGWTGVAPATTITRRRLVDLVLRYVRAFGPSSVGAVQTWLGITGLRSVVETMAAKGVLRPYDDDGVTVYDDAQVDVADPALPAPVRMLAPFDHAVVSNPHKERVIDGTHYKTVGGKNAVFPGFVLADGRVVATWKPRHSQSRSPGVELTYLTTVNRQRSTDIDDQCDRLHALLVGSSEEPMSHGTASGRTTS